MGSAFHYLLENKMEKTLDDVPLHEKEKIMIEASADYYFKTHHHEYENSVTELELETELMGNKYRGFIDLIALDDEQGDLLIDYKFVSSLQYADNYAYGDQALLYPVLYELQTGRKVRGMKFVCVVKPTIRQRKNEELHEYFTRVKEWYNEKERVREVHVPITEERENEIIQDLTFIQHMIDNEIFFKNTGSCLSFGSQCPFMPLCRGEQGARELYKIRGDE